MVEKQAAHEYRSWVSLFQPDVLAPLQYLDRWRGRHLQAPERLLMLAVLEDGISCFQRFSSARSPRGKEQFREAERWLMHENSDGLYAFDNICDVLGLDAGYLRAGLSRWRRGRQDH